MVAARRSEPPWENGVWLHVNRNEIWAHELGARAHVATGRDSR